MSYLPNIETNKGTKNMPQKQRIALPQKDIWLQAMAHDIANPNNSKFVTVQFVKKNGTLSQTTFNPAAIKKQTKGTDASESAQRAAATRKANHPDLINVVCATRSKARGKPAMVSFSSHNVTKIITGGKEYYLAK